MTRVSWQPGRLAQSIDTVTEAARASGAPQPLVTSLELIHQDGIDWQLRRLNKKILGVKGATSNSVCSEKSKNPFSPYDPLLYVSDVGEHHVCLLNKFPVLSRHLLIVTRNFKPQTELLARQEFLAACTAMAELPALCFYNGGKVAGASQHHCHMQLVPLSSFAGHLPIETRLNKTFVEDSFRGFFQAFEGGEWRDPDCCYELYQKGLRAIGCGTESGAGYNLLFTREWLLLVPRLQESVAGMSINGLGYAGAILATTETQVSWIERNGPLSLLQQAAVGGL